MAIDIVKYAPGRVRQVVFQKRENVDNLCRVLFAEPASLAELATLSLTSFTLTIRRMISDRRFQAGVLPAIKRGDYTIFEAVGSAPDERLLKWSAERLVPQDAHLRVRNAQGWDELLLTLFCTEGGLLRTFLQPGDVTHLDQQYAEWKLANPDRVRPLQTNMPTAQAVRQLFEVFLGRPPNKSDDVELRRRGGYPVLIRDLLRSTEFQKSFLAWLGDYKSPHAKLPVDGIGDVRDLLSSLFGWTLATPENQTESWEGFLASIWLVSDQRKELVGLLAHQDDPVDSYVRDLTDTACERLAASRQLIVSICENSRVHTILNLSARSAGRPLVMSLKTSDGPAIDKFEITHADPGRQLRTRSFDVLTLKRLSSSGLTLDVVTGAGQYSIPVLRRPFTGRAMDIAEKISWYLTKGQFEKADTLLFDLDAAGDEGLAFFMKRLTHRVTGFDTDIGSEAESRSPEWRMLAERLSNAGATSVQLGDLPAPVREWLSGSKSGQAVLDWLEGTVSQGDPVGHVVEAAMGGSPGEEFAEACDRLTSVPLLVSAIVALSLAGAESEYVQTVGARLNVHSKNAIRAAIRQAVSPLATIAILCASGRLEPDRAYDLGMSMGAAKSAEQTGAFGQALSIVSHAARVRPDVETLLFAGTMENKYGSVASAAEFFRLASEKRPDNFGLLERYLTIERGLVMADPLRADSAFLGRARVLREQRVKDLIRQPGSAERRVALAKALVIEGDDVSALDLLIAAEESGTNTPEGQKRLIDLCVKQNRNEEALAYCKRLPAEELSEWIVINQARALRALGRAEEAGHLLDRHAQDDWPSVSREAVRNRFFLADFDDATARGDALCALQPEDIELRLICAAAHFELGRVDDAERHIDIASTLSKAVRFEEELDLFRYAIARKRGEQQAVCRLNPMFARLGCSPIKAAGDHAGDFDSFVLDNDAPGPEQATSYPPLTDGPLVSVAMTSFNSEAYIDTAIASILDQRYRNLELIIVDDCSSDATPDILRRWAHRDPRVRIVLKNRNDGTYVSKNLAMLRAKGEYVALQDSDDWSHPDRIGKSVAVLEARRDLQGLTTDWLRMTNQGELLIKAGGMISHVCCISLVFRRQPVLDAIGAFDSVRIEADMEFIRRIGLAFGHRAVARLRWPLLFGRVRSDSLTGNEEFGITRTGFSTPRLDYQAHRDAWHARIRSGASPFMPFPLGERTFSAPEIILPDRKIEKEDA